EATGADKQPWVAEVLANETTRKRYRHLNVTLKLSNNVDIPVWAIAYRIEIRHKSGDQMPRGFYLAYECTGPGDNPDPLDCTPCNPDEDECFAFRAKYNGLPLLLLTNRKFHP